MRRPLATYRLQLHDNFTLHDANRIVPYLARLGISDLYLSPVMQSRVGSTHGYDVIDPTRVHERLGGEDALQTLSRTARSHGMGILLDIVPNHMAASAQGPWWRDVLRRGRASAYADYFDIDWGSHDRLLLPILGAELDAILARGELTFDVAAAELVYYEYRLPLAEPASASGAADTGALRRLLEQQHYVLLPWRAADRINYRRFFDITDLVGVRVEQPHVFDATHELVRRLAMDGVITGLRIDHIDGLCDPAGYLERLRQHVRDPAGGPVFTVVEKILHRTERLPAEWQCEGTTGYDFLNLLTGVLVDPDGFTRVAAFYRRVTGDPRDFAELVREKKLLVMDLLFAGELRALARQLSAITGRAADDCAAAIRAVTANLDVYRTYARTSRLRAEDRQRITAAVDEAKRLEPQLAADIAALRGVLTFTGVDPAAALSWVLRWQQFTGPVMAKGYEDTALYCHNVLLAINDVGSDPARPCFGADEFFAALRERQTLQPTSLNATATHDTKRGEDTRARIAVLSEVPDEWRGKLRRWMREGDEWKYDIADDDERIVADADVDNLLYQTLLGAWPLDGSGAAFTERVQQYMMKAVREAKEHTSWRRPDEDYEQALAELVSRLIGLAGRAGLPEEIAAFAQRLAPHGAMNSLLQLVLKIAAPGIPDIYQGTELWSFTLVDPDNRAPVDFPDRQLRLQSLEPLLANPAADAVSELREQWRDGRIKLYVTAAALRWRARHRAAFELGAPEPLRVQGPYAPRVLAFARRAQAERVLAVIGRWNARHESDDRGDGFWRDTTVRLPAARAEWRDVLTGNRFDPDVVPLSELFAVLPCALLETGAAL